MPQRQPVNDGGAPTVEPPKPKRSHELRKVYDAEDVRQGRIILTSRWRRYVFIAGLVGIVLCALIAVWFAAASGPPA